MTKFFRYVCLLLSSAFSCAVIADSSPYFGYLQPVPQGFGSYYNDLIGVNYGAADALAGQLKRSLPPVAPKSCTVDCRNAWATVVVASIVDSNRIDTTTPLGRLLSEHIMGRLSQHGYGVVELKIRENVYMKRNVGEFILTREVLEIAKSHNAHAIVVGTYSEASDRVFISIKTVESENNRVIAATDYFLYKDDVVRSLLRVAADDSSKKR